MASKEYGGTRHGDVGGVSGSAVTSQWEWVTRINANHLGLFSFRQVLDYLVPVFVLSISDMLTDGLCNGSFYFTKTITQVYK